MIKSSENKVQDQPKINDLIFKELIKRGYALEGNTHVWNIADSKLWYLTPEQSQGYLDLDADQEYKQETGQLQAENLITENLAEILEKIGDGPINIIDLGCGDGKKAAVIVQNIKEINPYMKVRYCPIDISGYMVEKAIETFSNLDVEEIIEFQYNISDFENLENITPLLRKGEFKKNLFLLLGNTLGNFEANELLYEIRSAMGFDDLFLVDIAINDQKQEERVEAYRKSKKFNDFLVYIPMQIGLSPDEVEWGARWRNSRIEFYYTVKKDKQINFQGRRIIFNKGDQIIVAIAYKHDKEALMTYLKLHFGDVILKISKDQSKAVGICKK